DGHYISYFGDNHPTYAGNVVKAMASAKDGYPEVARHLAWLARFGDARMTGSGACVFAGFGSEQAARAVLAQKPADMQGFVAQGLDHHPLRDF
ncbi:MAG: 4-(cytidine 5'-diphospho)-2-C-methyl-D-erythritol kinase, partial [Burkholderiales bacterium]